MGTCEQCMTWPKQMTGQSQRGSELTGATYEAWLEPWAQVLLINQSINQAPPASYLLDWGHGVNLMIKRERTSLVHNRLLFIFVWLYLHIFCAHQQSTDSHPPQNYKKDEKDKKSQISLIGLYFHLVCVFLKLLFSFLPSMCSILLLFRTFHADLLFNRSISCTASATMHVLIYI